MRLDSFPESPWIHSAALSARPEMADSILESLVQCEPEFSLAASEARRDYLRRVARVTGTGRSPGGGEGTLDALITAERLAATQKTVRLGPLSPWRSR